MTKLSPDLANPTRELAQNLSNAVEEHWKALERLVGHIKGKQYEGLGYRMPYCLKIQTMLKMQITGNAFHPVCTQ